jgi:hypothetical protein
MLRGLRSQLPNIAKDPFRQQWIAPWIGTQLKVESKQVRTWFALYEKKGGDAMAVKGDGSELADDTSDSADVPSASISAPSPSSLPPTTGVSPEVPGSVTVTASPATLPSAAPAEQGDEFFTPALTEEAKKPAVWTQNKAEGNRAGKLQGVEGNPEIQWQAVGMMRALEGQLPLLAQMHGFDDVIADELNVHKKVVKDWWTQYRLTGTVDESVPPMGADEPKKLKARIRGYNQYDSEHFESRQRKAVAEETARLSRRKKVRSCDAGLTAGYDRGCC